MSGDNGAEYTCKEALDLGYESTIEYLVNESKANNTRELIVDILESVKASYYDGAEYDYILNDSENQFAVCFIV